MNPTRLSIRSVSRAWARSASLALRPRLQTRSITRRENACVICRLHWTSYSVSDACEAHRSDEQLTTDGHPGNLTPVLLEASPGFLDFLVGHSLRTRPCFHSRLTVLGDGLSDHPAGNSVLG